MLHFRRRSSRARISTSDTQTSFWSDRSRLQQHQLSAIHAPLATRPRPSAYPAARQGSRMSLASDDLEHVIIVPGRHFAPTASAGLATAISGDEVEGDFAQEGEVAGGGTIAHATVVLADGDVEHPMQGVFDAPVPADGWDQDGG